MTGGQIGETKRLDDVMDKLNTAIKAYLTSLDTDFLTEADHRRVAEILAFATHMEQAGDIVDKSLLGLAMEEAAPWPRLFPGGAGRASGDHRPADRKTSHAAAALFMTADERGARLLAAEKEAFRNLEATATGRAFRPAAGGAASIRLRRVPCTSTRCATLSA